PSDGDVRNLPQTPPLKRERPEFEEPDAHPIPAPGTETAQGPSAEPPAPSVSGPAPGSSSNFDGLDFQTWGAGHPPDTNGDVGPNHYIQTVNTSIGNFDKSGNRLAAFTFNTFMSQGNFGNLCDTNNFGDSVVVYDTFEDRWVITDFAFVLSGGNVVAPAFECFAVSKTGDALVGGWNYYATTFTCSLGE